MENHSLETEEGMHCSWCGKLLPFCECPAKLARSIDKERAEAIRERNELRAALLAACREVERMQSALCDDAFCVSQWFVDSWTGDPDEPVYQAAQRIWAALAATQEPR